MPRHRRTLLAASAMWAVLWLASTAARAEDWQPFNPFADIDRKKAEQQKRQGGAADDGKSRPLLRPMNAPGDQGQLSGQPGDGQEPVPGADRPVRQQAVIQEQAIPPPVERGDIEPVMAADGSGLPSELWQGLDVVAVEKLISGLEIPPRSPALHNLWKRLITSEAAPPTGDVAGAKFNAVRLEALYRSGLARDAAAEIAKVPASASEPFMTALAARNELASGNAEKACQMTTSAGALKGEIPRRLKSQLILMSGYCSALANDAPSAGLAAELAREEGLEASLGLEALDAISVGATKPKFSTAKEISLLDYRLAERVGGVSHKDILEKGEPALLVALAGDPTTPVDLGLPATEAAARLNALTPEALAGIYRVNAGPETPDALLAAGGAAVNGPIRRASLLKAAETEQTPMKKTRLIRAFLDDAKRQGLAFQAMQMMAPAAAALNPQPEISWFSETGAEIGLASGQYDSARRWIALADGPDRGRGTTGQTLEHWLALVDIADPNMRQRGESLTALESLAVTGRFPPDALHRLATVLDALGYNVPIPLWEAASRTPQPNTGYLPETGVLSELQDAAKKKQFGRTVLLAMKALGPNGAEGAHMIALGDSIRALKRAGLEADARRLGLEALLGSWPRTATN